MFGLERVWEPRNRTPVLAASAILTTAVAVIDWWIKPYVSLGFLYLSHHARRRVSPAMGGAAVGRRVCRSRGGTSTYKTGCRMPAATTVLSTSPRSTVAVAYWTLALPKAQ